MEPLDLVGYRRLIIPLEDEVEICTKHFGDVIIPFIKQQRRLDKDING
jgi:hypothetical protein